MLFPKVAGKYYNSLFISCQEINWQEILDNNDANDDYNTLFERFNEVYDECIPLKSAPLIEKEILCHHGLLKVGLLKSINKKNKLYKQYIQSSTNGNLQKFKTYKNKLNMFILKSKRMYLFTKFGKKKLI